MPDDVLLDTSFFLRFLNEKDVLFKNADGYYHYFLEKEISMVISTISIAEFCVLGTIDQLPLKNLKILPFNLSHSKKAGEFARIIFEARKLGQLESTERKTISNDTKLFAQADVEPNIKYFATSDRRCLNPFDSLREKTSPQFQIIDITKKHSEVFGILEL